jgi:hypothetical protein
MAFLGKLFLWGFAVIGGLLVLILITAPDPGPQRGGSYVATSHSQCVELGVDYYRRIGSFPRLSDGRDARGVANERCGRSISAFNNLR